MQKDEVSAVIAPSALGNKAEIKAIIKMIEMIAGTPSPNAMVGNNLSGAVLIPLALAYKYKSPPKNKNNNTTSAWISEKGSCMNYVMAL